MEKQTISGHCSITVNDKIVDLKFNRMSVEFASRVKGNTTFLSNLMASIWGAVLCNAFSSQAEPNITFEEIADWVEGQNCEGDPDKHFEKITEAFQSSLYYRKVFKKEEQPGNGRG